MDYFKVYPAFTGGYTLSAKRFKLTLTEAERSKLHELIDKGKTQACKQRHARILLKADQEPRGPCWTDEQVSQAREITQQGRDILKNALVLFSKMPGNVSRS